MSTFKPEFTKTFFDLNEATDYAQSLTDKGFKPSIDSYYDTDDEGYEAHEVKAYTKKKAREEEILANQYEPPPKKAWKDLPPDLQEYYTDLANKRELAAKAQQVRATKTALEKAKAAVIKDKHFPGGYSAKGKGKGSLWIPKVPDPIDDLPELPLVVSRRYDWNPSALKLPIASRKLPWLPKDISFSFAPKPSGRAKYNWTPKRAVPAIKTGRAKYNWVPKNSPPFVFKGVVPRRTPMDWSSK